jgi:hypothetical protein
MGIEKAPCISAKCFSLFSVAEKVRPKRILFIENLFLFGCQLVRVIMEHVEKLLLVESENKFAFQFLCVVNPPNLVGWVVLEQFI